MEVVTIHDTSDVTPPLGFYSMVVMKLFKTAKLFAIGKSLPLAIESSYDYPSKGFAFLFSSSASSSTFCARGTL